MRKWRMVCIDVTVSVLTNLMFLQIWAIKLCLGACDAMQSGTE